MAFAVMGTKLGPLVNIKIQLILAFRALRVRLINWVEIFLEKYYYY